MNVQDLDEIASNLCFYVLIVVYEGPHHGYSIISREEMEFCGVHCGEFYMRETSSKSVDREQ